MRQDKRERLTGGGARARASDRAFGVAFAATFAVVGAVVRLASASLSAWLLVISGALLAVAFLTPELLSPLNALRARLLDSVTIPLVLRRLQRRDVGLREKGKASANVTHTGEVRHLTLEYEGPNDDRVLIGGDVPERADLERRVRRRSPNIKDKLYEMQGGRCNADAEFLAPRHFTLDHIVPTSKEGPDIDDNLQLLCHPHNSMKNNGTMADLDRRMRGAGETPWDNPPLRVAEAERDFGQSERKRRRARLV